MQQNKDITTDKFNQYYHIVDQPNIPSINKTHLTPCKARKKSNRAVHLSSYFSFSSSATKIHHRVQKSPDPIPHHLPIQLSRTTLPRSQILASNTSNTSKTVLRNFWISTQTSPIPFLTHVQHSSITDSRTCSPTTVALALKFPTYCCCCCCSSDGQILLLVATSLLRANLITPLALSTCLTFFWADFSHGTLRIGHIICPRIECNVWCVIDLVFKFLRQITASYGWVILALRFNIWVA